MNDLQTFTFEQTSEEDNGASSYVSHGYTCSKASTWYPIMLQFAAFLEGCGYVGVDERVRYMLDSWDDHK